MSGLAAAPENDADELDDDTLLAALGVDDELSDITDLRHARPSAEKRAAEEIAQSERRADFASFKPLFEQVQRDLEQGVRTARWFERKSEIEPRRFFILSGRKAYVAEKGRAEINASGNSDTCLRVIFGNGTKSNLLMRSLQKTLTSDEADHRIADPVAGPLFAGKPQDDGEANGTIYADGTTRLTRLGKMTTASMSWSISRQTSVQTCLSGPVSYPSPQSAARFWQRLPGTACRQVP